MTRFGLMTGAVTIIEPRLFLSLVTFRKKRSRHFSTSGNRLEINLQVQRERFFSIQAYIGQIRHYGIGILYDPLSLSAGFFSGLSCHRRNAVRTRGVSRLLALVGDPFQHRRPFNGVPETPEPDGRAPWVCRANCAHHRG